MTLNPIVRKVLLGAAGSSLDVAGAALLPGAWPILKGALEPVLERLRERLGGEDITSSTQLAAAAAAEFEADSHLQEMLRSRLLERLDALIQDQEKIGVDVQKLMLGVTMVEARLDEGVDLSDQAIAKLTQAISRQAESSRQVKALALREMGPLGELIARQVGRLQVRAVELVATGDVDRAIDELREGLVLVAALLSEAPTDIRMRLHLGFIHKTAAQVYDAIGHHNGKEQHLGLAEEIFRSIKEDVGGDQKTALDVANAIHGLGNIDHERRYFHAAIEKYNLAVSIYPAQVYSWHDMFGAYCELARGGELHLPEMRRAFENVKQRGEGIPGLGAQHIVRLERVLEGLEASRAAPIEPKGGGSTIGPPRGADLTIFPSSVTIVIAEQQRDAAILNLSCRIANSSLTGQSLSRLEMSVLAPSGARFDLPWTVFYDGGSSGLAFGQRMAKTCDAHRLEIPAKETIDLGVQFAGRAPDPEMPWIAGVYKCHLRGWADAEQERSMSTVARFDVIISEIDVSHIQSWRHATKDQSDRLNDPDRAVGFPVQIGVTS